MTTAWKSGYEAALDNLPLAKLCLREIVSTIGKQGCVRFRTGGPGEGIAIDSVGFTKVMTAVL